MDDSPNFGSGDLLYPFDTSGPNAIDDQINDYDGPRLTAVQSKSAHEDVSSETMDTCRICRSEGTVEEPLFYPCKCSGSIKFVHQECLMEWLSHSQKKYCELCKTPFRFTKLYDAGMPQVLPWPVFLQRACIHAIMTLLGAFRATIVAIIWMVILPWLIRWAWRWMFWIADAGWAREAFILRVRDVQSQLQAVGLNQTSRSGSLTNLFEDFTNTRNLENLSMAEPIVLSLAKEVIASLNFSNVFGSANQSANDTMGEFATSASGPYADTSILSSWTYISELTSNPGTNRIILDVFEGQLITCVVITGFILVFLIREWVVQQQPLANIDNIDLAAQQLVAAAEEVQAHEERIRRQTELVERARAALVQFELDIAESEEEMITIDENVTRETWHGWDELAGTMDSATLHELRDHDATTAHFKHIVRKVVEKIQSAQRQGVDMDELTTNVRKKLEDFSSDERQKWYAEFDRAIEQMIRKSDVPKVLLKRLIRGQSMPDVNDRSQRGSRIRWVLQNVPEDIFNPEELTLFKALSPVDARESGKTSDPDDFRKETDLSLQEQHLLPPEKTSLAEQTADAINSIKHPSQSGSDDIPIANAGPEAKVNIKLHRPGTSRPVPEPSPKRFLTETELRKRLEQDTALAQLEQEIEAEDEGSKDVLEGSSAPRPSSNVPGQVTPEPSTSIENLPDERLRVGGIPLEDWGFNEAEENELIRFIGTRPTGQTPQNNEVIPERAQGPDAVPQNRFHRVIDWFWGDIPLEPHLPEEAHPPNEEPLDEANAAQFVPAHEPQPNRMGQAQRRNDPEVVAAAAEAGIDAEAAEDAEDLEGILELIGLQGPLIGLFQTSTFCVVLVAGTIYGAVGLPYVWGKMVLSFLSSPVYYLLMMPLQLASVIADLVIDIALVACSWTVLSLGLAWNFLFGAIETIVPSIGGIAFGERVSTVALRTATSSITRLQNLFVTSGPSEMSTTGFGLSWKLLHGSMHAHASLRDIQGEINSVLHYLGMFITSVVDAVSSGSLSLLKAHVLNTISGVLELRGKFGIEIVDRYARPLLQSLRGLRTGALTFQNPEVPLDPALAYWSSSDRSFTVLTGYFALAAIAAVYVAMDTPISFSETAQKTEKILLDTLRQAGGILKVILIISIEMLAFPLYCGLLLDIAFMPLFHESSLATRWAFAVYRPYTFCFIHWFVGTCYMFHFALFVGMCRKILRKGLLWFIRDPDDPTFHPVRDVLERGIVTQLRKIAFSALVYGALVILCLGGVIWTIGHVFEGIFPIRWISTEPVLEFPMDLLLYNAVSPILLRLFKPSDAISSIYAWWLRHCARFLRLSHFLFDDRRIDEEGRYVRKTWLSFFFLRKLEVHEMSVVSEGEQSSKDDENTEVSFKRDGKYVLTPCNDQYRPPKPDEAFLYFDDDDVYIADKNGKKNDHFAKAYIPPLFRIRITLFMVCLWIFSAFVGLCVTLVPLVVGRQLLTAIVSKKVRVNDIYAYSIGAYLLGGLLFLAHRIRQALKRFGRRSDSRPATNLMAWAKPVVRVAIRVSKCFYVYGFIGIVFPAIFALVLQCYVVIPLHTLASSSRTSYADVGESNTTLSGVFNNTRTISNTTQVPDQMENQHYTAHTIHLLQDYCLGLLWMRIGGRMILQHPAMARAAAAGRRIVTNGFANPDVRLATRYLIAPTLLIATAFLCFPPLMASLTIMVVSVAEPKGQSMAASLQTRIYRYSYPLMACCLMVVLCTFALAKATSRWRAMIRDEVYLVGERLHNFGEKRPPEGSRSVRRREN